MANFIVMGLQSPLFPAAAVARICGVQPKASCNKLHNIRRASLTFTGGRQAQV